jgi:hypothetical protein
MNPWVAFGVPALVAASGVTAAVVSTVTGDDSPSAGPAAAVVWIDAPLDNVVLAPGTIVVQAHAIGDGLASLELLVDGASVGIDTELTFTEGLGYGEVEWQATEGVHELQVRDQVGNASLVNVVTIQGAGTAPPTTMPTTLPTSTTSTTVAPSTTTSTTTTTIAPTTVAPTAPPTTSPPTPTVGTPNAQQGECTVPYVGTVQASVANATAAQVRVVATGLDTTVTMSIASGTASAQVPLSINGGSHTFTVTVSGPGGSASASTTRTIDSCKP